MAGMDFQTCSMCRLQETEERRVESGEPEASLILLFFLCDFWGWGGSSDTVKRAKDGSLRQAAAVDCGCLSWHEKKGLT